MRSQIMYYIKLLGVWIKRREVEDGARRIRSEKLREHLYREGYARFPGSNSTIG